MDSSMLVVVTSSVVDDNWDDCMVGRTALVPFQTTDCDGPVEWAPPRTKDGRTIERRNSDGGKLATVR